MYPEALDLLKYDLDFLLDGHLTLTGSKSERARERERERARVRRWRQPHRDQLQ